MADDLGENWWEDNESGHLEDKAKTEHGAGSTMTGEDYGGESAKDPPPTKASKMESGASRAVADEKTTEKKRKRPNKRRITTSRIEKKGANPAQLRSTIEEFFRGKLSVVESDEMNIPDNAVSPTNVDLTHTMPSFLRKALPKWQRISSAHSHKMSPLILVLSSNTNRALQINKESSAFKGSKCKTAKLFARHMKIEDQAKFLQSTVIHFAIGTPARVTSLLDQGSLILDHTRLVVLDWNWRDVKMKRMIDIVDVRKSLMTLMKNHLAPAVKSKNLKIGLY